MLINEHSYNSTLKVKNLSKNFGTIKAVKNLNFSIEESSTVALLGSNGAGKTTTIMMLMGILKPSFGEVRIFDYNVFCPTPVLLAPVVFNFNAC